MENKINIDWDKLTNKILEETKEVIKTVKEKPSEPEYSEKVIKLKEFLENNNMGCGKNNSQIAELVSIIIDEKIPYVAPLKKKRKKKLPNFKVHPWTIIKDQSNKIGLLFPKDRDEDWDGDINILFNCRSWDEICFEEIANLVQEEDKIKGFIEMLKIQVEVLNEVPTEYFIREVNKI